MQLLNPFSNLWSVIRKAEGKRRQRAEGDGGMGGWGDGGMDDCSLSPPLPFSPRTIPIEVRGQDRRSSIISKDLIRKL
jgi:hypothetical protein